jgi:hypothetical protein
MILFFVKAAGARDKYTASGHHGVKHCPRLVNGLQSVSSRLHGCFHF